MICVFFFLTPMLYIYFTSVVQTSLLNFLTHVTRLLGFCWSENILVFFHVLLKPVSAYVFLLLNLLLQIKDFLWNFTIYRDGPVQSTETRQGWRHKITLLQKIVVKKDLFGVNFTEKILYLIHVCVYIYIYICIGYWPRQGLHFPFRPKSRSISYLSYIYWPFLGFLTFRLSYRLALT